MLLSALVFPAFALVPFEGGAPCATSTLRSARASGAGPAIDPPAFAAGEGIDTEHFHIAGYNYDASAEELALVGEVFEAVWDREIEQMGYEQPYGTDTGKFTVYIERLGRGLYGYTDVERDGKTPYIAVNSDMSWTGTTTQAAIEVTAAHEFFHAIQFAYDYWEASWWMESSSVWMEEQVYDDNNDYLYYLSDDAWPDYVEISMTAENGWHEYGEGIWTMYLSEQHGGQDTVRTLWEACATANAPGIFADHFGGAEAFEAVLVDFHVRNALGYAGYEEGGNWHPVYREDLGADASALPVTVTPEQWRTDYLGVNYFRLPLPEFTPASVVVDFAGGTTEAGGKVRWQVSVVGTDGSTWDVATDVTKEATTVTLGGFGDRWHEAWVLVTILTDDTGVNHDAYDASMAYDKQPPAYTFTVSLGPPAAPDDTGTDTGTDTASDTGGDSGSVDCCKGDDTGGAGDPECGCASGQAGVGGVLALFVSMGLARRRRPAS
jgi:hypothetical protein